MDDTQTKEIAAADPQKDEVETRQSVSRRAAAIEAAYILEAVRK